MRPALPSPSPPPRDTVEESDELVLVYFTLPTSEEYVEYSGENLTYGDPDTTIVTIIDDGMTPQA